MVRSDLKSSTAIGRPRGEAAVSHVAIMDAVCELLKEKPARDLTMDAVAKRANVGKPTLYKWWPTKAALIMAMFHERLVGKFEAPATATAEEVLRLKMTRLIKLFNGLFGKVVADLIAEGQGDPAVLKEFYDSHIRIRWEAAVADIDRGIASGEFLPGTNSEVLVDTIFGPMYYRLLLRVAPLTQDYGRQLIDQALLGVRSGEKAQKVGKTRGRRVSK